MGCGVCSTVCPVKDGGAIKMVPLAEALAKGEDKNWEYAVELPEADTSKFKKDTVKGCQFSTPLFEFSGACPYTTTNRAEVPRGLTRCSKTTRNSAMA